MNGWLTLLPTRRVIKNGLKVFLLAIVPLLTLGFNVFEMSTIYSRLLGLRGVELALATKLTTQYDDPHRMLVDHASAPEEFDHLWALSRRYSVAKLPADPPLLIARTAIENGAFVEIPGRGKVVLIPDSVPVIALWCTEHELAAGKCEEKESILLGTVRDLREWTEKKGKAVRSTIDFLVAAVSIALGLALEFGLKE